MNDIRRRNIALQSDDNLQFFPTDNPLLICYAKATDDLSNVMVTVVNLDPFHVQSGWVTLDLHALGIAEDQAFQAHDLITDSRFIWKGARNYVKLTRRAARRTFCACASGSATEEDFDYYV